MGDNNTGDLMGGISSGISALTGVAQAIGGAIQQKKYTKKVEGMVKGYKPNASIMDFYNKALAKYSPNAYDSASYRQGQQNIQSNLATGISATQNRGAGVGAVGSLVAGANRASLGNIANAENINSAALGRLGQATTMKAQEDKYGFEMLANLYGAKATGGANIMNAGLTNIGNAANSFSQMQMMNNTYGNSANGGRNSRSNASARALAGE
jgi:hypothetical protein